MPDFVSEYIRKIEDGSVVVPRTVSKWYLDRVRPIVEGKDERWVFKPKLGNAPIAFCETFCRQSKGQWSGKPMRLMLFQKARLQSVFGIVSREDGLRRFKEVLDIRGRKNGKSTELSAMALYLTLTEKGAEIYCAATVASQARRIWEEAQSMVDQDADLTSVFGYKVFPVPTIYTRKLPSRPVQSTFKVLSKNVKTFDGLNASGAFIDEIHELPRSIYDILKQSMTARRQPLLFMSSTAGFVRGGLFDDEVSYARKVIDGTVDDEGLFPTIYELDDPSEMDDESAWVKANPAIGVVKSFKTLKANVERAKEDLNFANSVKTKDFNVIGVSDTAWLDAQTIQKGAFGPYSREEVGQAGTATQEEFLRRFDGTQIVCGYDLSRTGDMTAFTYLLFDRERRAVVAVPMFWVTERFLRSPEAVQSKVPFRQWIDRGLVRVGGENAIDYRKVAGYVEEIRAPHRYIVQYIAYDPWSATYLTKELEEIGYSSGPNGCQVPVRQGFKSLSIPMQALEELLRDGRLCYLDNPVMKWCLANVQLVQDANGNMMPSKDKERSANKIDGVATLLDALYVFCGDPGFFLPDAGKADLSGNSEDNIGGGNDGTLL